MVKSLIPYSPIRHRPPLRWPNGARVALMIVPNVEHYEYLPKLIGPVDPWPRSPHPDLLGYSQYDYGNRVGIWRFLEMAADLGLRCTVSVNMAVIERFPAILEAMERLEWEYMSHGIYNTRFHWGYSPEEERAAMIESQEIHLQLTGRRQRGWFSPAITNTPNTFELAAEVGYDYTCDLFLDDQPVPIPVLSGRILGLPYSLTVNDWSVMGRAGEAAEFARVITDTFDTLYAEGATNGRVMTIALHPHIIGQPHRIGPLREALDYVIGHPGVWQATGGEITDWYNAEYLSQFEQHLADRGVNND